MNTAVLDRPVTKSSKKADVILNKPKAKAAEKADLKKHAAEIEAKAAEKKPAPVKAKAAPKAPKAEPKPRKVSAMWVIRTNMAEAIVTTGKPATVEMISKACTEAGVPKSDATISTIISDFMQSYLAMKTVGLVKA